MPCTVMASPGTRVSLFQPLCWRSIGLSSSIAQLRIWFFGSLTFTNTCTCGLAQSTSVTMPVRVMGLLSSNLAEMAWCAAPRSVASTIALTTATINTPAGRSLIANPFRGSHYWRLIFSWPLPRWLFHVPVMPRLCIARFSILPSST